MRVGALLAALPALTVLSGCSLQQLAVDTMVPAFVKTKDDFMRGNQVQQARESGPALISLINGVVLASPDNVELRLLQAELNAAFAFAFLEHENHRWATDHYKRAQAAALVALADEDDDLAAALPKAPLAQVKALLAAADVDALPALFWWGFARGSQININRNDTKLVADLGRVDAVMEWVISKNENFFFAGPHMFFAMRYMSLPASLGGKPKKGLEHFNMVESLTRGKLLMAKVLKAQFYAPTLASTEPGAKKSEVLAAQRRAWDAFFNGLKEVLDAPDDLWPAQNLVNAVAKKRALALLKDPEANNIIVPKGVKNPYAVAKDDEGGWGDDDDDE